MNTQGQSHDFRGAGPGGAAHPSSGRAQPGAPDPNGSSQALGAEGDYQYARNEQVNQGPGAQMPPPPNLPTDTTSMSNSRELPVREGPKVNGSGGKTKPPAGQRICWKCGQQLSGQFVRAIGGTFHLECFKCQDCGQVVASKFFPVDNESGDGQYPLCETDYFRRLDLICHNCGGALRGSYVTAIDRKYHIDHFTCSVCPAAFGAKDSYYEHGGNVYCHYHYSTKFAQRCNGCQTAILKQFVEIYRNGENQHWHPECYMIHKFWNVRLSRSEKTPAEPIEVEEDASEETRLAIRQEEEQMEERTYRIWSVLSTFEETSAACISDMLLHVSNGAYMEGVLVAKKFIYYVDVLFTATDQLDACITSHGLNGLSYGREAKLLCKRIVSFFTLLTKNSDTGIKRLGVTQELLSLVTGLAHYLKLLIRISLQGALKLEREKKSNDGLRIFLDDLSDLDTTPASGVSSDDSSSIMDLADEQSDLCGECQQPIDDECLRLGMRRWHRKHFRCGGCQRDLGHEPSLDRVGWLEHEQQVVCPDCSANHGIPVSSLIPVERVSRLQQYVYLLRVALARLLAVLRSGGTLPHTSDDPNLSTFDSNEGHRIVPSIMEPPKLSAENRSRSYGGESMGEQPSQSSYAETVGEMKRLRSTRMEKSLSTSFKTTRTSRIIDGPEAQDVAAGADGKEKRQSTFRVIEDRDINGEARTELTFGKHDGVTLDDLPRILAAEQAKEQRPNAYKHSHNKLVGGRPQAKLVGGTRHQTTMSDDLTGGLQNYPVERTKRYFSELSGLEYFIVRHVAVLQMQPLLEGHFNIEDLLSLIELKKQNFWNKLFKNANKNERSAKPSKKKGVFGVGLEALVERDGVESTYGVGPGALRVPTLLDDSITAMRQMDMSVEGVFRKNGNIRRLKDLADRIDAKEADVDLGKENAVQVAALLKRFLREMPDPLLTHKLYSLFITSQKIKDADKRLRVLHLTCCLLPKAHRDSLEVLFSFLTWAASFSQVDEETGSKMDAHNLATVVAPNILYANAPDGLTDESFFAIEAVHMLLEYNDQLCEVPEDIQSVLSDTELFNNMPEITTKEILKRYGDLARTPDKQFGATKPERADAPPLRSPEAAAAVSPGANGRPSAVPVAPRIEPENARQATAWQKESSVRPVQPHPNGAGAGTGPYAHGNFSSSQGNFGGSQGNFSGSQGNFSASAQHLQEHPSRASPYHLRSGSASSLASQGASGTGTPGRQRGPPNWGRSTPNGPLGGAV